MGPYAKGPKYLTVGYLRVSMLGSVLGRYLMVEYLDP